MNETRTPTVIEAMGFRFGTGPTLGRNMRDAHLEKIVAKDSKYPPDCQAAARVLLEHTVQAKDAATGGVVRIPKPQKESEPTPPNQKVVESVAEARTPDQEAQDEWQALRSEVKELVRLHRLLIETVRELKDAVGLCTDASTSTAENMAKFVQKIVDATKDAKPAQTQRSNTSAQADGTFPTEKIEAKKEKGRLSFRVFGAQFTKFGVMCWPEILEAAGLTPEDFPIGEEVKFKGWSAEYVNGDPGEDGKIWPKKVVALKRIEPASQSCGRSRQPHPPPPEDEWTNF